MGKFKCTTNLAGGGRKVTGRGACLQVWLVEWDMGGGGENTPHALRHIGDESVVIDVCVCLYTRYSTSGQSIHWSLFMDARYEVSRKGGGSKSC